MQNITDENFEQTIHENKRVLVDMSAVWCQPCRKQALILEEIENEYNGKVFIGGLNVDENNKVADEYKVDVIPAILMFKDEKLVHRIEGLKGAKVMKEHIKEHLGV